jgi:uncharacterized protein (DUF983 family)
MKFLTVMVTCQKCASDFKPGFFAYLPIGFVSTSFYCPNCDYDNQISRADSVGIYMASITLAFPLFALMLYLDLSEYITLPAIGMIYVLISRLLTVAHLRHSAEPFES